MADLRTNGLWQGIRHRSMGEGAEEPSLAVHRQISRRPDRRGAHIARKNGIFGRKLVEHSDHILRMDRFSAGFTGRQVIETLACLLTVLARGLQMLVVFVL